MVTILRPRSTAANGAEDAGALAAPVRDALWILARQFQTGAFIADDGGDPILVVLASNTGDLTLLDGTPVIQPQLEGQPGFEPDQYETSARVHATAELRRMLVDTGMAADRITAAYAALTAAYPLQPVTANSPLTAYTRRVPDPAPLYQLLMTTLNSDGTGPFPTLPAGVSFTTDPLAEPALRSWVNWMSTEAASNHPLFPNTPPHWDTKHLAYNVTATCDIPGAALTLNAAGYDATALDWFAFDVATATAATGTTANAPVVIRPAPVTFAGMPQPRFWALEDGDVNLDMITGQDAAHALLTAFAHSYTNDWFLLPLDVKPGVTVIDTLEVTDTFAVTTTIPAAAVFDGDDTNWRMWDLTPPPPPAGGSSVPANTAGLGARVFLTPMTAPLESAPLDDLLIARDELANLGWMIETATRDGDGTPVDRNHRWLQQRPPADPTFNPATAAELAAYRLGTNLPDYWYPLLAQTATDGSRQLACATLPVGATDVPDAGVVGQLLAHDAETVLADEEASRTGTRVSSVHRIARVLGVRRSWLAWIRRPGTGEASSGLRFDVLGVPAIAPNLVVNSDFTIARREPTAPLVGRSPSGTGNIPVDSPWEVWNNADTTTTSTIEPTTRPGGIGWMLRITTKAAGCGLAQQWGDNGTGPTTGLAQAWVYAVTGTVTLGCGNGGSSGQGSVDSIVTGEWVLLQAPNGSSPVNEVILYAASIGGAEYLVDLVSVHATA